MELFIVAALCGVLIGIFSGLLGVGGGTLMVPLLRLGFGMPALSATATSLFTIIPTSITGFVTHLRNHTCIPKVGIAAGLAGAVTSPLGVLAASYSPAWLVMVAAALIVGYSAYNMLRKAIKLSKPTKAKDAQGEAARAKGAQAKAAPAKLTREERAAQKKRAREESRAAMDAVVPDLPPKKLALAAGIGLIAGFCSGYVGVGGGFIMVPLFVAWLGIMMKQASGTSLVAIVILAIPGVVTQGLLGNINYLAGIAMACGSIPGAVAGANLIRYIPERKLRFLFAAFLGFAAVMLVVNEVVQL